MPTSGLTAVVHRKKSIARRRPILPGLLCPVTSPATIALPHSTMLTDRIPGTCTSFKVLTPSDSSSAGGVPSFLRRSARGNPNGWVYAPLGDRTGWADAPLCVAELQPAARPNACGGVSRAWAGVGTPPRLQAKRLWQRVNFGRAYAPLVAIIGGCAPLPVSKAQRQCSLTSTRVLHNHWDTKLRTAARSASTHRCRFPGVLLI